MKIKTLFLSILGLFLSSFIICHETSATENWKDGKVLSEETFIFLNEDQDSKDYMDLKMDDKGQIENLAKSLTQSENKNVKISTNDISATALPAGVATNVCSYKSSVKDIVCNWSGTIFNDKIYQSWMKMDWLLNNIWFHTDKFFYSVNISTSIIRDQATMDVSDFGGKYKSHLYGSVDGFRGNYKLYSWSKVITVP
jgi:hypothetical protein